MTFLRTNDVVKGLNPVPFGKEKDIVNRGKELLKDTC